MISLDPRLLLLCLPLLCCSASPEAGSGARADAPAGSSVATFAGGCFWCMEKPFEQLDGVHSAVSGYAGGVEVEPTYEQVAGGRTGHAEAVQVHFDPRRIGYEALLAVFWRQVDPTDAGGQFVDRGPQYRTTIWVHDAAQREAAEASRAELEASSRFSSPIDTPIEDFTSFWPAEDSHQDYYLKNPGHYLRYRRGSGRDLFLERVWADDRAATSLAPGTPPQAASVQTAPSAAGSRFVKPTEAELRAQLTPLQYRVTQEDGTEPPFKNLYWNDERAGIYVDIVSGEPLYSSAHAFSSGTGWPSFWRALVPSNVVRSTDRHLGYPRTELRSAAADSHLGHVFADGPPPTGERHCINSAALRFVPEERMEAEGYGEYLPLTRGE